MRRRKCRRAFPADVDINEPLKKQPDRGHALRLVDHDALGVHQQRANVCRRRQPELLGRNGPVVSVKPGHSSSLGKHPQDRRFSRAARAQKHAGLGRPVPEEKPCKLSGNLCRHVSSVKNGQCITRISDRKRVLHCSFFQQPLRREIPCRIFLRGGTEQKYTPLQVLCRLHRFAFCVRRLRVADVGLFFPARARREPPCKRPERPRRIRV